MLFENLPALEFRNWWAIRLTLVSLLLTALFAGLFGINLENVQAEKFAAPAFERTWARADLPAVTQSVQRGYVYGQEPFFNTYEEYSEAPNGRRLVQYFDKARMEITRPALDISTNGPFYVTNGLIVKELIMGTTQLGDNRYVSRMPAFDVPIAGDPYEYNPDAPTYASFFNQVAVLFPTILNLGTSPCAVGSACSSRIRINEPVTEVLNKDGSVGRSEGLGTLPGTKIVYYDRALKHNVPQVFWEYLNQTGIVFNGSSYTNDLVFDWVSTFGYPLAEPFWVNTRVAGVLKSVMVQVFERRVLTYTPGNPPGYQVEMGNVGQHYYKWRYSPKYDLSVPACAFCSVTPQAAFPGAIFIIRTESIFLNVSGTAETVTIVTIGPDGKIVTNLSLLGLPGSSVGFQDPLDPGRVKLAILTNTTTPRGLYTVIITGNATGQQAKAFFSVISIPGVAINFA